MKHIKSGLLILGILFISFNLRAPITCVGSVVELIQNDFGLSNTVAGFITTLPLVAFAVVSPFVARIAGKFGPGRTMLAGLCLLLAGEFIRSYTGAAGLFMGTAVIGVGIAIGNVIVPGIIKQNFDHHVGTVTSVYTSGMCIYAAVGAGISVPLATGLGWGWKHTLASWFVLTTLTILIWLPQVLAKHTPNESKVHHGSGSSIWKSRLAWWVTLFMGLQSLVFYSLVAWLPTIVVSKGMTTAFAGHMALLFQLMAIPATLLIPSLCDRFADQRILAVATCAIYACGMTLFLLSGSAGVIIAAVVLLAIGMGGCISLSIAFISLRTPSALRAAQLSGMSQSAGYLLAAVGPIITGFLFDLHSSWTIPMLLFIALIVCLALCGLHAGKNDTVEE